MRLNPDTTAGEKVIAAFMIVILSPLAVAEMILVTLLGAVRGAAGAIDRWGENLSEIWR
jgi:hypothetical protein